MLATTGSAHARRIQGGILADGAGSNSSRAQCIQHSLQQCSMTHNAYERRPW
jgi:hypothetical protein